MRFALTEEQQGFAEALDDLLTASDTPRLAREWADGAHASGLKLWRRLAEMGVTGLLVDEDRGGLGGDEVDLTVAFEALGRHAVPGPWVESAALLPVALRGTAHGEVAAGLAGGDTPLTVGVRDLAPLLLDADVASACFVLEGTTLHEARPGELRRSVDPVRRLFSAEAGAAVADLDQQTVARACDTATLAAAAQLLGAGERLLAEAVGYARQRKQFGRAVGEYQALKHALADVRVGLDFARPLVQVAALSLREESSEVNRDVSAAKVAAGDAAYAAARTALQVHGAIGYTAEHDLSLWLLKVRALVTAWGTPVFHRARVLHALTSASEEA